MAQPTEEINRGLELETKFNTLPVAAGVTIEKGAVVGINSSGYAKMIDGTNDTLAGVAAEKVDNSGGVDGEVNVEVIHEGIAFVTISSGITQANVGGAVYVEEGDTFNTATTADRVLFGYIHRYLTGNDAMVKFDSTFR